MRCPGHTLGFAERTFQRPSNFVHYLYLVLSTIRSRWCTYVSLHRGFENIHDLLDNLLSWLETYAENITSFSSPDYSTIACETDKYAYKRAGEGERRYSFPTQSKSGIWPHPSGRDRHN
jgi:hypothetical protein